MVAVELACEPDMEESSDTEAVGLDRKGTEFEKTSSAEPPLLLALGVIHDGAEPAPLDCKYCPDVPTAPLANKGPLTAVELINVAVLLKVWAALNVCVEFNRA